MNKFKFLASFIFAIVLFVGCNNAKAVSGTFNPYDHKWVSSLDNNQINTPNVAPNLMPSVDLSTIPGASNYTNYMALPNSGSDTGAYFLFFYNSSSGSFNFVDYTTGGYPGRAAYFSGTGMIVYIYSNGSHGTPATVTNYDCTTYINNPNTSYLWKNGYYMPITSIYNNILGANQVSGSAISRKIIYSISYTEDYKSCDIYMELQNKQSNDTLYYSFNSDFSNEQQIQNGFVLENLTENQNIYMRYKTDGVVQNSITINLDKLKGLGVSSNFTCNVGVSNSIAYFTPHVDSNSFTIFCKVIQGNENITEDYTEFRQVTNGTQFSITGKPSTNFTVLFEIRKADLTTVVYDRTYTISISESGVTTAQAMSDTSTKVDDFPAFPTGLNPIDYIVWFVDVIKWLINLLISFITTLVSGFSALGTLF
jgi:hypothetical protein